MSTNELAKEEQNVKAWQEDRALARFQMISPLLDESLDQAKRVELREQLSMQYQVSTRSLYRYEDYYRKNGFAGLKPMNRESRRRLVRICSGLLRRAAWNSFGIWLFWMSFLPLRIGRVSVFVLL